MKSQNSNEQMPRREVEYWNGVMDIYFFWACVAWTVGVPMLWMVLIFFLPENPQP